MSEQRQGTPEDPTDQRCPTCGVGVVSDIGWDVTDPLAEREGRPRDIRQKGDSRQVTRYSCGHEVLGPGMETSDQERLDVERRRSEDTT